MGHCADQHPVLENRGAGHPLHDAAGQLQQLGVGDVQDHVFGGLVLKRRGFSPAMVVRILTGPE